MWVVSGAVLVSYLAVVTVLMLTPGPDMLFVLASGIRSGSKAGFVAAVGVAAGEAVHLLAAAAGLAALFRAAPLLYDLMRFAGAAYLVWLGVRTLRGRAGGIADGQGGAASTRRAFWRGLVTNVLNPKMALFTLALLPQFVDPSRGQVPAQFLVLGACFLALEIAVDGTVGLAAGRVRRFLAGRRRAARGVEVASGSVFLGLGARLAITR
ncbi:MAG TPA: LysE family translocator [Actinomycetota bacterium]|nr:LysE family translocator [Actinomycetota bacterium]